MENSLAYSKIIGENLRIFREKKGFTINYLSEKTKVSVSTIFRYEKGESQKIDQLEILAHELDINLIDLFSASGNITNKDFVTVKYDFGEQLSFSLACLLNFRLIDCNTLSKNIYIKTSEFPILGFLQDYNDFAVRFSRYFCDEKGQLKESYFDAQTEIYNSYVKKFNEIAIKNGHITK